MPSFIQIGPIPRRVSSLWTLVPWILPRWLTPAWVWENVERAVYDGYTRQEWFQMQVNAIHDAQRNRAGLSNGTDDQEKHGS